MNYLKNFDGVPLFVENFTDVGDSSSEHSLHGHNQVK